mmetsp:Transcript_3158/g.19495  ORF Transcript_3158/g.19495 Transcript_3158/m.19495 type:complete len:200 (+) Transcript_3158:224-823(+)
MAQTLRVLRGLTQRKGGTSEVRRTLLQFIPSFQRRHFLPFLGDEEEGKTHRETKIVHFTPEQLFEVVVDVNKYKEFVPWCQNSRILFWRDQQHFDAELEVGFKVFVERYTTQVKIRKPSVVECKVADSHLFTYLDSTWKFEPAKKPGSTLVHFRVDFLFRSPIYRQAASMFFEEVVQSQLQAFEERCYNVYGPPSDVST